GRSSGGGGRGGLRRLRERDTRNRWGIRFRQERENVVGAGPVPERAREDRQRRGDVPETRPLEAVEEVAAQSPRQPDGDHLPGSDDVAEPGAEDRVPARRDDQGAPSGHEGLRDQETGDPAPEHGWHPAA